MDLFYSKGSAPVGKDSVDVGIVNVAVFNLEGTLTKTFKTELICVSQI